MANLTTKFSSSKSDTQTARRKPGRPRSQTARGAILWTTWQIIEEEGFDALTVEAVAKRAGVGKPTIYRYWENAQDLAISALTARNALETTPRIDGEGLMGFATLILYTEKRFSTPAGRLMIRLLASLDPDSERYDNFRHQVLDRTLAIGRQKLEQARMMGQLRADIDIGAALEMAIGAILARMILGANGVTLNAFCIRIVEQLRAPGVGAKGRA
jgi:AcrR family transcriptional regulator